MITEVNKYNNDNKNPIMDIIFFIIACIVILFISIFLNSCTSSKPIEKEIIYVPDTISRKELNEYVKTTECIRRENDSLKAVVDSLTTEVVYNKFKLERIRYYNDIARKGNNIVFLRGWINRVLKEE